MNTPEPCPRIEALSALIDDELSEPEREALEAHVRGCALCAPVLSELAQLQVRFATLPMTTPAFDVTPEVMRRIDASDVKRPARRPFGHSPNPLLHRLTRCHL